MSKSENPVISFLGKVTDLVVLNLLCIVFSIPVFTIGAVWTALYYVTVKMVKNEESYIWADFFKSFKLNFKQATIIWMGNLVLLLSVASIFVFALGMSADNPIGWGFGIAMVVFCIIFAEMIYLYAVLSHFDNTIGVTIKNAFLLAIANLPYTVAMLIIVAFPFVAVYLFATVGKYILPVCILIGISGPAYICSFMWKRIFAKLDNKGDQGEINGQEEERQY